jgi:hypothetical protein
MNMDIDLVNRALLNVGQTGLEAGDMPVDGNGGSTAFRLCKQYYLETFLEALSEVEWVGGRKRAKLTLTGRPVLRNRKYRYAYDVPFDCAKPIELQMDEYFIVEDRLILTDAAEAELLYVSNGKVLRPVRIVSAGRPGDIPEMEYVTGGRPGSAPEVTLYAGRPADISGEVPVDGPYDEDFPDYRALEYEPKFYQYIETMLSVKFSMKLSNQPGLHTQLLQTAMLIKAEAVNASKSGRAAKKKSRSWWTDSMGGGIE